MNNPEKELDERDWFAAHAPVPAIVFLDQEQQLSQMEKLANSAYMYADAMMKRRKQK